MSGFSFGKSGLGAVGATAVVALVAGCASSSSGTSAGGGGSRSGSSSASKVAVSGSANGLKTMSTSIGTVLVDGSGRTVYELVGDSASKSTCTGGCLAIWPAVKADGTQVIVNGHRAYTYVGDKAPGQTKGQNLTDQWGLWLALDPSGNPIHGGPTPAPQTSTSKAKAPGGGGPAF